MPTTSTITGDTPSGELSSEKSSAFATKNWQHHTDTDDINGMAEVPSTVLGGYFMAQVGPVMPARKSVVTR